MKDKVNFYDGLNETECRMYESIDDFLSLSRRFSRKAVNDKRNMAVIFCLLLSVLILVLCVVLGGRSHVILGAVNSALLIGGAAVAWYRRRNNYFPEVERVNNIIRNDGLEAVYNDLMRASPVVGSDTVSGGRYLFTAGRAMCRLENISRVYAKYVSYGRHGSYYACAEVADETGIYQHYMAKLPMFRRDQQLEKISEELFRLKMGASMQDK
ncbi:MAG: hypothetical protein E7494_15350 [Ruminococcus albus]|nr:hypothetical protein [Ruminococcus albus]